MSFSESSAMDTRSGEKGARYVPWIEPSSAAHAGRSSCAATFEPSAATKSCGSSTATAISVVDGPPAATAANIDSTSFERSK